jgi:polysaccharide export outer membrane protein
MEIDSLNAGARPYKALRSQNLPVRRPSAGFSEEGHFLNESMSMMFRSWSVFVMACGVVAVLCGSGCAAQPAHVASQTPVGATGTPASPAAHTESAPGAETAQKQYIIGPGDSLQIFVWNHPELSVTLPVRPDGQISTPLVENMPAAGHTASELARALEGRLSEYVRSPTVNVIVTQPLSTFSEVKVVGQVTKPQAMPFREGMTVMDVVLAAGGLSEFAAGNRAKIVRMSGGRTQDIKVRLTDLVNKGDMKQNVVMKPGDVLVVPESRF